MAGRVRIFSEIDSENLLGELKASIPTHKRRRIQTGLNARFDNMVERMNIHGSPRKGRRRAPASVSSSVIDSAYDNISGGRLGHAFSVIKMRKEPSDSGSTATAPLPDWLSNTFSTLAHDNPLRLLLPDDSYASSPTPSSLDTFSSPMLDTASADTLSSPILDPASADSPVLDTANIFATPGPVYYEDPLSDPGLCNVDDIDFEWKPFNRKQPMLETAVAPKPFIEPPELLDPERAYEVHEKAYSPGRFRFTASSPSISESAVVPQAPSSSQDTIESWN